mmetsp:Transcript_9317/g.25269  ORF Transcript_9317/g.25269 Transcript_9317/m.25269 type:complete len:97 (-) Transcript_9317:187-477(-)
MLCYAMPCRAVPCRAVVCKPRHPQRKVSIGSTRLRTCLAQYPMQMTVGQNIASHDIALLHQEVVQQRPGNYPNHDHRDDSKAQIPFLTSLSQFSSR